MEWINNYNVLNSATERPMNEVPEWARAEHMEASSPLCELWKLSGEVADVKPEQKNCTKKLVFMRSTRFYTDFLKKICRKNTRVSQFS